MKVAFEGMDGSGKTSISKKIARRNNFQYLEKPIKTFFNLREEDYQVLCESIYRQDVVKRSYFFFFSNFIAMQNEGDYVIDRHILSNYFWNGTSETYNLFKRFLNDKTIPEITIILHSEIESRIRHIKCRNPFDKDLRDSRKMQYGYDKMITFADNNKIPYIVIDTDYYCYHEIVELCNEIVEKCKSFDKEQMQKFCRAVNKSELEKSEKIYAKYMKSYYI